MTELENAQIALKDEKFEVAQVNFEAQTKMDPLCLEAHIGLGDAGFGLGDYEAADTAYRTALELDPRSADALFGLAATLRVSESYEEAVMLYEKGFEAEPERTEAYWELAYSREMNGDKAGAEEAYRSCLTHHPNHGMAAHLLAAMTGAKTKRAPENYVRDLFDDYAETFDSDLVEGLNYVVPQIIAKTLSAFTSEHPPAGTPAFQSVLDLGCGTGLVAEAVRPFAGHITGVDLSEKMLEVATSKGRIDERVVSDMIEFFGSSVEEVGGYDLIVSGDALVYLGDLETLFAGVNTNLNPDGLFCFTIEDLPAGGFELMPTGRFAHNTRYIDALIAATGLAVDRHEAIVPRTDSNEEIPGRLYLISKKPRQQKD